MKAVLEQLSDPVARALSGRAPGGLLLAASGGTDSTALALVVAHLVAGGRTAGPLTLGHIDHGLHDHRRRAAQQVARLARELGVGFLEARIAAPRESPNEASLRDARYGALEQLATSASASTLLTAHHWDDQLETVLFRSLRGAGPAALAGIPAARQLSPGLTVLRPLLTVRRRQLEQLVADAGTPIVEDPSNADTAHTRNLLRHVLLPGLRRRHGARVDEVLSGVAAAAREVSTLLDRGCARVIQRRVRAVTPWRAELILDHGDEPVPFVEETIRRLLRSVARAEPPWSTVQRACSLLRGPSGARVHGPRQPLIERTRDGLLLVDPSRAGTPPTSAQPLVPGDEPQRFGTTEWAISATAAGSPPTTRHPDPERATLDPDAAPMPWRIRARRPGDRFWPLGMPGPVDLRSFEIGRHLCRYDRDRLPLVVDAHDRVIWVPGVEISHHARLRESSGRCVELTGGVAASARSY